MYDFRYLQTEKNNQNYLIRCVEIPEITLTVSKKAEDTIMMTSYNLMHEKLLKFIKENPEKVKPFVHKENQGMIQNDYYPSLVLENLNYNRVMSQVMLAQSATTSKLN